LKSRQIWRLQKEVKSLLQIQTQQAQTIEATFEDTRELEEKLHLYEQKQKSDEKTIKTLQERLNEITTQYQKLLNNHVSLSEEEIKVGIL
jgi:hypothetical protein